MEGIINFFCFCLENFFFCVFKKCGCDVKICNNIFLILIINKIYIFIDNIIEGKGLFVKIFLVEEEWVIEFVGEVIILDELIYRL